MNLGIAFRAFFAALGSREKAEQIDKVLGGAVALEAPRKAAGEPPSKPAEPPPEQKPAEPRNPAVTLLATLQREARLVDLVREDLDQYSDAQVGAAARPCLQQTGAVLERVLGLQPLLDASEGDSVQVGEHPSPTRYQWLGESSASTGKLVHHGWQATRVELPTWTGDADDAGVIAAAQIQAP
jgi:hypothetical protein